MNKADYIHLFKEACGGKCNAEYNPCAFRQAADSLAALQPVAWQNLHLPDEFYDAELLDPSWYSHYRPLYALDEANHDT
jgi:hypothetical protein